jgi:polysaccharide export outer membrane protein
MRSANWMKVLGTILLTMGFVSGAAAQQNAMLHTTPTGSNAPAANPDEPRPALQHRPRYQIQRTDTLVLTFPLATEYNQIVVVRPDGYITLMGVGDLHVENMDTDQVHEAIRKAYVDGKILHEPLFTVDITDFQKPQIVVIGQVNKPGKYELRDDTTVTGAVAEAGGFVTGYAKHSDIVVFHKVNNDWSEAKTINLKQLLKSKNLSEDIHLQPGDIVYVPQNTFTKFKSIVPYSVPLGLYQNYAL